MCQLSGKSLPDDYGETVLDGDRPVSIYLDPQANDTADELMDTIRHESCHVYLGSAGNNHGPAFQTCMARFQK